MTYEQFERFFNAIDRYYEREREFDKCFETFNSSHTLVEFCPEITNCIFEFLKEEFKDESDWINWWYFERRGRVELKAYDVNKKEIKLDTLKELYQFLIGD